MRPLALLLCLAALPAAAQETCRTASTGAACILVPQAARTVALAEAPETMIREGDVLERGRYSILMNADYYGLPPVADGWVYMRVGSDVYRVDWTSHAVLERVTDRTAANF
jgi:hypothetical protein